MFSLEADHISYNWSVVPDRGGALSHASVFGVPSISVPEPGTLALLGIGLLGFAIRRRSLR